MKRILALLMWLVAALLSLAPAAHAQSAADYTQGVSASGSSAVVWFKPTLTTTTCVDVHYKLNSGAQQNLRMTLNPTSARYEKSVANAATADNALTYSFTYNKGAPAYDSPWFRSGAKTCRSDLSLRTSILRCGVSG